MSPRPRRVADSTILSAAFKVVSQTGPGGFTLADVGTEVGLSAATLVQRFGSKRLLMLAMLEQAVGQMSRRFLDKVEHGDSPLATLYSAALERADPTHGPENVANGMAFMLLEINDPDFQLIAETSARQAIDTYKLMLDNAIDSGELSDANIDTENLAQSIHAMTLGSLLMRVIFRDSEPNARTRRDLDNLLLAYRKTPAPAHAITHENGSKAKGPKSMAPAPASDWQF